MRSWPIIQVNDVDALTFLASDGPLHVLLGTTLGWHKTLLSNLLPLLPGPLTHNSSVV